MRLFENKSVYNAGAGKWEEVFLIDGENVPADIYDHEQYKEKIIMDSKFKEAMSNVREHCNCSECSCEENPIEDLVNLYADIISDDCECRDCIYDSLQSFVGDILECIEGSEEFEIDEDVEIDEDMNVDMGGFVIKFTVG